MIQTYLELIVSYNLKYNFNKCKIDYMLILHLFDKCYLWIINKLFLWKYTSLIFILTLLKNVSPLYFYKMFNIGWTYLNPIIKKNTKYK